MEIKELTQLVLQKLDWSNDKVLRAKWGSNPPILAGEFIEAVLGTTSIPAAAKVLGRSPKPLGLIVDNFLVPIFGRVHGGNETWRYKLLSLIEYQKCQKCGEYKSFLDFSLDRHTPNGIDYKCKICKSEINKESYTKENIKASIKKSQEKHYHDILARNAEYRAERKLRTVIWADQEKLKEIYNNCPEGMHVDHIIPLKGELVSGLHVPQNLQYLDPTENIKKGNRYNID